jgi:hypothetical protein
LLLCNFFSFSLTAASLGWLLVHATVALGAVSLPHMLAQKEHKRKDLELWVLLLLPETYLQNTNSVQNTNSIVEIP